MKNCTFISFFFNFCLFFFTPCTPTTAFLLSAPPSPLPYLHLPEISISLQKRATLG